MNINNINIQYDIRNSNMQYREYIFVAQATFNIFAILINILQYIDLYIGQSGVNISAILEYIDNILINISNNYNIGNKY